MLEYNYTQSHNILGINPLHPSHTQHPSTRDSRPLFTPTPFTPVVPQLDEELTLGRGAVGNITLLHRMMRFMADVRGIACKPINRDQR